MTAASIRRRLGYAPVRLFAPARQLVAIDLTEANSRVLAWHRHHGPVIQCRFALGLLLPDGELHGVAIVEEAKNRILARRGYSEVTRCATDGTKNACSQLYAACRREARRRQYGPRIITYILASEPGTSLRAAGWEFEAFVTGRSWDTPTRRRDTANLGDKQRWGTAL